MSLGAVVALDTQQLLRAVCGVAFSRARMSAVYRFLRGVDPVTGEADPDTPLKLLTELDGAANDCIELTRWRDYLLRVKHAGFVSQTLLASKNAIVNAYAFYIRGRKAGVPKPKLDAVISRWVFGSLLTARYSASSETAFEQDLGRLAPPSVDDGPTVSYARSTTQWLRRLLVTTGRRHSYRPSRRRRPELQLRWRSGRRKSFLARGPSFQTSYCKTCSIHHRRGRAAREAHHLVPTTWLLSRGISDRRQVNQVANLADVGWHENNIIGGQSPAAYVPRLRDQLGIDDNRWGRMCAEHALPMGHPPARIVGVSRQKSNNLH